ncbi:CidA/LrgA family protein [Bacillus aquiflavi]|uniref:CidA/LrgA family protein n=1 Tax=Bacillus aquiflavi TaxID=2672567 RepID=A0A6B3W4U2_9BACI|nr:CidA/LrgA family protein [Bacillus aquiflavi]MBA4538643.1 CidA/LrgA family protein [Bacillus aquiflavi]NEY83003.1 CidA/LrgA family protein [Bacillus aquiflavi]UAC49585.1 CidA/LrgA family protein [Bacillus aquiflavi]
MPITKRIFIILAQLLFLIVIHQLGNLTVTFLHLPLPGNVMGIIFLFILLLTGVIKLSWIEETSVFLIKHLGFFFIPISVGLMTLGSIFLENGIFLIIVLVTSAFIGISVTGLFTQSLAKRKVGTSDEHHHHTV